MKRIGAIGFIAALAAGAPASAQVSSPADALAVQLFGKTPITGKASVCFRRSYDARHMATHPQQNVTTMLLLVTADANKDAPNNHSVQIGVTFRGRAPRFEVDGFCSAQAKGLDCGVECDGGHIDVSLRDGKSVLVKIPDGARVSKPGGDGDVTGRTFGADDKVFRVDRTKITDCLPLAHEAKERARLSRGR